MIIKSINRIFRKHIVVFSTGFVFAILCFITLNAAMEPASRPRFCGSQCHEMKTAYRTWELSTHGTNKSGFRVECVDCHLPSKEDEYFAHVFTKAYEGDKDVFKHHFIGGYDIEKARVKALKHMPNKRCLHCHDSLLTRPGSSAARKAHLQVSAFPKAPENKCVKCHINVGHQRINKLFTKYKRSK